MAVTRMRILEKAHEELLASDPGCALTKNALRSLVLSGAVRSVMIGRKRLIDMDNLEQFLAGKIAYTPSPEPKAPGIRRVEY